MRNTNTKICLLLLAAGVLCCAGCESTQQARQNEMTQAQQMVNSLSGSQHLTPAQRAYLTAMTYNRMEQNRIVRETAQAQIVASGFQNAGAIIAQGYQAPTVVYPLYNPLYSPVFNPVPIPTQPIPVVSRIGP
jgi:hypothetical protein